MLVPFVEDQPRRRHQVEHGATMLRSSRGAGTWQNSGKPRSYCGHRPCTTNENGRAPHCSLWARVPRSPPSLAERRRPGQRQHIEVELSGLVLPAVLRQREPGGERHGDHDGGDERTTSDERNLAMQYPSLNSMYQVCLIGLPDHHEARNVTRTKRKCIEAINNNYLLSNVQRSYVRSGSRPLGPRHLAGRVIGPVAVEADHAPFDP